MDDQYGRLTFTSDMADAIFHLLDSGAGYGTYNLTGSGAVKSWADIARTVFDLTNGNGGKIKPISTAEYSRTRKRPVGCPPVRTYSRRWIWPRSSHGPGRAGLGGVSEGVRHQGTQEVTDLSRAVSSRERPRLV